MPSAGRWRERSQSDTADAMPGYAFHEVGAGYIDVRAAVETARTTAGERAAFLDGDTAWSSRGDWNSFADGDSRLRYEGTWTVQSSAAASDGSYHVGNASEAGSLRARFTGDTIKLLFATDAQGGVADVYVDGAKHGTVSFFSSSAGTSNAPFGGLGPGSHALEVRPMQGNTYVDGLLLEGALFPGDTTFVDESQTFTGTMGPSAQDLEIDRYTIEVPADATTIKGTLAWTGLLDLDMYLVDPNGERVASGATLENPEALEYTVGQPGTYTFEVTGFATVAASYTLTSVVTRAVTP